MKQRKKTRMNRASSRLNKSGRLKALISLLIKRGMTSRGTPLSHLMKSDSILKTIFWFFKV